MGLDAWGPESNGSHARISVVTSGTSESLITALSETLLLCMTFDFFFSLFYFLDTVFFIDLRVYHLSSSSPSNQPSNLLISTCFEVLLQNNFFY